MAVPVSAQAPVVPEHPVHPEQPPVELAECPKAVPAALAATGKMASRVAMATLVSPVIIPQDILRATVIPVFAAQQALAVAAVAVAVAAMAMISSLVKTLVVPAAAVVVAEPAEEAAAVVNLRVALSLSSCQIPIP